MKKILVATIGLGKKEDEGKSLMNLIVNNCKIYSSDLYGFYTEDSKKQKKYLEEKLNELDIYNEFKLLKNPDNPNECYDEMYEVFEKIKEKYIIYVNPTAGTKVMTSCLTQVALNSEKVEKIYFHGGKRTEGRVIPGTENENYIDLKIIRERKRYLKAKNYANINLFQSALNILDKMISENNPDYLNLIDTDFNDVYNSIKISYDLDNFKIKEIFDKENIRDLKNIPNKEYLNQFKGSYMKFNKSQTKENLIEYLNFMLHEIYLNAERHANFEEYDNASARIYRAFEVYSQKNMCELGLMNIELFKSEGIFCLNEKEFIEKFKEKEKLEKILAKAENGIIKTALGDNLIISKEAKLLSEEEVINIKNCLNIRNGSILAHGFNNITKEEYEKFKSILLSKLDKKILEKGKIEFNFNI